MSVGTYLSGTGHAVLIVWMIAGWGMQVEPLPFEITEVFVVSDKDFAAMTQGVQPELPPGDPVAIEQPAVDDTPPVPEAEAPPEVPDAPVQVEPPVAETPPDAPNLTLPETVATDSPPVVPDTPTIVAPPPSAEIGSSTRPVPRPATRVAPEIITPPEPDATVAPEVATAATVQVEAPVEETTEPVEETTSPEEAATEIVTEADIPEFAPEVSRRPQTRPNRPAAVAEGPGEEVVDPVAAALAEAGATDPEPSTTPTAGLSGGQLSEGDKSGFLRQVGKCWNTGALSTGAQNTIIDMVFDMTPDGRPVAGSIRPDGFTGGSAADADAAFKAARRALIRCTSDTGYDLPADQYDQWKRVVLTVDPTAMRQR